MSFHHPHGALALFLLLAGGLAPAACGGVDDQASPGRDASAEASLSPDAAEDSGGAQDAAPVDASACVSDFAVSTTCVQPPPVIACADGFCQIPAGCFVIGSPACEPGRGAYSEDEVQVTLTHGFELAQLETSQADWVAAGFQNPSRVDPGGYGDCLDPECPLGHATWFEAVAYANHRSEVAGLPACYALAQCTGAPGTGMTCGSITLTAPSLYECTGYRLPSEAEWEYAARAGTRTAFYSGPMRVPAPGEPCVLEPNLEPIAWYCHNSGGLSHLRGKLKPNAWGLYDLLGNQAEWTHDRFNGLGYGPGPLVDPHGQLEIDGTEYSRVTRGGVITDVPSVLRAANRFDYVPSTAAWGFRLARTRFP